MSASLAERVRAAAVEEPDRLAFAFLGDDGRIAARLSRGELDAEARRIARWLLAEGAGGERALLLYPPGLDFVAGFLGCLYAGVVAVPGYPPRNPRHLPRIQAMARSAGARRVLTVASTRRRIGAWLERSEGLGELAVVATDEPGGVDLAAREPVLPRGDDLAFLQFTSGSTSTPRGVEVTHGNLLSNLAALSQGSGSGPASCFVSWLPHFHDMGLVGAILQPLSLGCPAYLLDPAAFLQRPLRWLEAISQLGGTHTLAPNFAYDLAAAKADSLPPGALDLRSWQSAVNAAEPLRAETLERFVAAFAAHGFSPSVFQPGYGMAEATLMATGSPPGTPPVIRTVDAVELERGRAVPGERGRCRRLVSSGRAAQGVELRIVDPESRRERRRNEVGEVWLAGPSVARGYWGEALVTAETFDGRLAEGGGPYLRTGDLGFLDADGELFVTGRRKDLILVDGANHYPQDVERTVEGCHPAFRPSSAAAFSEEVDGREALCVVQELERTERRAVDVEAAFAAARQAIAEEHELRLERLVLVPAGALPKTSSGKVQRRACRAALADGTLAIQGEARAPALAASPSSAPTSDAVSPEDLRGWLRARIGELAGVAAERIEDDAPLARYGLASRDAVALSGELATRLGQSLPATLVYDHPTIAALVERLAGEGAAPRPSSSVRRAGRQEAGRREPSRWPIAVVGLGCRFPGAGDPEAFWRLLDEGREAVGEVPADRWDAAAFHDPDAEAAGKIASRRGGFLERVDELDAAFFHLSRREAERLDPQQRLLLEVAWEALEDAGIRADTLEGSATGVFVGCSHSDYGQLQLGSGPAALDAHVGTGTALSAAAGRLSYFLGLEGPSLVVDTACSSSLVALHLACRSLERGECSLALVGGVNLMLSPELSVSFSRARMLSPAGRCRSFDAGADGYVRGEGCGVVVLEPLAAARAAGRRARALVRGSAVNQDGRSNGLTAPSGRAQERVVRAALADAGVAPHEIAYVEAHGTGTPLGDPIELGALSRVFAESRPDGQPLLVGSVKTNLGHLEAAAGVAGVIKTVLALERGVVPASLHFERLPDAAGDPAGLAVAATPRVLPPSPDRLAGVSSFGFVGTNAHVVLAAAPEPPVPAEPQAGEEPRRPHLLVTSARSEGALRELAGRLGERLATTGEAELADLCAATALDRSHLPRRLALVVDEVGAARAALDRFRRDGRAPRLRRGESGAGEARPVFVFAGQGSVHPGMGAELIAREPTFRRSLEAADEVLRPLLAPAEGRSRAAPTAEGRSRAAPVSLFDVLTAEPESAWLARTELAQPALVAFELALVELWRSWGIEPAAAIGHSLGEHAAAAVAGVVSSVDVLRWVAARGRLLATSPAGAMLAAATSEAAVAPLLAPFGDAVAIAAVNARDRLVLSGPAEVVPEVERALRAAGVETRRLAVPQAFHSPAMDAVLGPLGELAATMRLAPPRCPLVSSLGGRVVGAEVGRPEHWQRQARETVRFADGVAELERLGFRLFVEIGPDGTLSALGRRASGPGAVWLPGPRRGEELRPLVEALGELYVRGARVDWRGVVGARRRRPVALPTYPFERQRYWLAPAATTPSAPMSLGGGPDHPLLGRSLDLGGRRCWRGTLAAGALPFLGDHRIEGATVFPAAGYAEMGVAAAATLPDFSPTVTVELTEVVFERPLTLGEEGAREVETHLEPRDGGHRFEVLSRPRADGAAGGWVRHAVATVRLGERHPTTLEVEEIRARCGGGELASEAFYAAWAARGNGWGPTFQGIEQVWLGDGEGLARLRLPPPVGDGYRIHPGWLDACGQVLAAVAPSPPAGAFVGHGAAAMRLLAAPRGTTFWSHAVVRPSADRPELLCGDVVVADGEGRVIVELAGVELDFLRAGERTAVDPLRWLHAVAWRPLAAGGVAEGVAGGEVVGCALLGGEGAGAEAAARALVAAGARRPHAVAPLDAARRLLHLGGLDLAGSPVDAGAGVARLARLLGELSTLVRRLAALPPGRAPRLWLATPGAWRLPADRRPASPLAAGLWGFARSLAVEHPELWGGIVDLEPGSEPAADFGHRLLAALAIAERTGENAREDALALRGGTIVVPRLVRCSTAPPGAELALGAPRAGAELALGAPRVGAEGAPRFRTDASYLITGGLGALGLRFAEWIVAHGGRRLVLLGRRGLPPRRRWDAVDPRSPDGRAVATIRGLEARGASVHLEAVDVADAEALGRWLEAFRADGWPPLRGVVHAAGVIEPALVADLEPASIASQLAGKVAGALLLDRLLAADPLDFFVLFSSASALLPSPRLAVYAAANAVLDALATERRGRGLPATSLAWGAWSGPGLAAHLAGLGSGPGGAERQLGSEPRIDPRRGLELAGRCWSLPTPCLAVLPLDWAEWTRQHPAAATAPLLRELVREVAGGDVAVDVAEDGLPPGGPDPEWIASRLTGWLVAQAARVLRQEPATLDPETPLTALGFDSLMALELRHRLESRLGVAIPAVELLRGPSLGQLATRLREALARLAEAETSPPGPLSLTGEGESERIQLDGAETFPLSQAQRAQWLLWRLDPTSPAYHVAFSARVRGPLDLEALRRAAEALARRHPSLRATVELRDGEPWQRIAVEPRVEVERIAAVGLDNEGLDDAGLSRLAAEVYRRPFDLVAGPLLRLHLLSRGDDDGLLLVVVHHLACDGWSLWIVVDELGSLLAAERGLAAEPLAPLAASFEDHLRAEQRLLAGEEGERLWQHWRRELSGEPPELVLPGQRRRPEVAAWRGASHRFALSPALTRALRELGRAHGATLYATLLAAYAALLQRLGGVDEVRLGAPTAGRGDSRLAGVVGDFVNPVVLRLAAGGRPSFERWLERVQSTVLDALAHAELPFQLLVERLPHDRRPGRHPLYQLDFVLQQAQRGEAALALMAPAGEGVVVRWGGLELEPFPLPQQEGQLDLSLEMADSGGGLVGLFKYDAGLFAAEDVARLAGLFERLLAAATADPARRLDEIPLFDAGERARLLAAGHASAVVADRRPLHLGVWDQARAAPDAVAIETTEGSLTYGALWRRACALAQRLRRRGVGADSVVALRLERSPAMVEAMLGVLVAGGAYLPLDLEAPPERTDELLRDAGAALVLAGGATVEGGAGDAVVAAATEASSESLAYVLFTSGSTGRPKAVAVPHRAIVNHMRWMQRALPLTSGDRVLQRTAASFDASVWEVWAPLLAGATLVLAPPGLRLDPAGLVAALAASRASVLQLVPSLLQLVVDEPGLASCTALRRLCVGGEPLPRELRDRLLGVRPDLELVNLYGPTEATIDATFHLCRSSDGEAVPIGLPIDGTSARVLDRRLEPQPAGAVGELCLAGAGLARGYLGRPAATARAFVPDPDPGFGSGAGGRLYRTGDRARRLPGGGLECLGRIDRQVKLRGHRIELGEVEARLLACPGVREAAVDVRADEAAKDEASARLVAYLVAENGRPLAIPEIVRALRRRLPAVMVPSSFVAVEALPRTAGGKLDRRALPAPGRERPLHDASYRAPRGELEQLVASVWAATLGVDEPGAEDSFFDLGGHSLLLAKAHARLEAALGRELPLIELFQHPTIRSLAAYLAGELEPRPGRAGEHGERRAERRSGRLAARVERRAARRRPREGRLLAEAES